LFGDEISFHWLPGYAPELNPVERVWSHTKYAELANNLPADATALWKDVFRSLTAKRRRPDLLRAFYRHTGLAL
jgi:transposase